ncbi:MAG: DUF2141 domain-containing protein [Chitinophagaceae bacterium]|nr:DUF2141 domain-containing protein [Chitinophagaceae bacterium]
MKMIKSLFVALLFTPLFSYAGEVVVTIKNLESNKGSIRLHVYTGEEDFHNKKPYKILTYSKQKETNGILVLRVTLPAGEYGISLLDDENNNKQMDYNIVHMPKEGFGFSDYYHSGLSMPQYKNFKFILEEATPKNVTVKMRYL